MKKISIIVVNAFPNSEFPFTKDKLILYQAGNTSLLPNNLLGILHNCTTGRFAKFGQSKLRTLYSLANYIPIYNVPFLLTNQKMYSYLLILDKDLPYKKKPSYA